MQITSAVNREHVLEPACPDDDDEDDDDDELFGPKTTMVETDGGTSRRLMLQSADYFLPGFKCRVECPAKETMSLKPIHQSLSLSVDC
jgi:hypothetical protein